MRARAWPTEVVNLERLVWWARPALAALAPRRRAALTATPRGLAAVANVLLERGQRKGDKVALLAPNSVPALEVLFGTLRAGGVIVPLSGLLTAQILAKLVDDSDARFMFVAAEYSDLVEPIRARRGNLAENGWFGLGFSRDCFADYEAALERVSNARRAAVVLPEDDCNIIYSSGTTGTPKGIVHTHWASSLFG